MHIYSLVSILVSVVFVSGQISFTPRTHLFNQQSHKPRSYYQGDSLLSSASISQNSLIPRQSFQSISGPPERRFSSAHNTQPYGNGIKSIFSKVIEEATEFVERGENPVAINHTFSTGHHGHHHHHGSGRGMGHHKYCKFTPTTEKIGKISNIHIKAYEILTKQHQVPKSQALSYLGSRLPDFCRKEQLQKPSCDRNARYRSIDGTCNNLQSPFWGSSFTQFDRLAPAVYEDGWNEPRGGGRSLRGTGLPNPRVVSSSFHTDYAHPDNEMTNMVPQFGQFLDHDMTLTPESDKKCCSTDANNVDCWPIRIPTDDYFYSKLRHPQKCMDFTRSTPYCFPNAEGTREQMNIVTAFVDASHVYAAEDNRTRILRSHRGGRLRTNSKNSGFLPTVQEVQTATGEHFEFMGKFLGGEERVNEMPGLTVMHTLLFREHNRLADEISSRRPYWNDETIFQEARRILIAEWQNSVYGEYLPIILGDFTIVRYGLKLNDNDIFSKYDPNLNPTIFHAFADAAYRFGHTLINGLIRMMEGFQEVNQYKIRDNFFNHEQISFLGGKGYDLILGGLMAQNSQSYDPFITDDVTNFLFKEKQHDFGADLIARNLQRAREHGLPGYSIYRKICGLTGLSNSWTNRPSNIPEEGWLILASLYETPLDIDLFTGGLAEVPVPQAVTGDTFNCLKAVQFARTKFGDRFFFTHANQPGSFSLEQLKQIRKRTFGDIICQNSAVDMTTRNVFKMPSEDNPMLSCNDPSRSRFNVDIFLRIRA